MYPSYQGSPELAGMHQAEIRAHREAIRQDKQAQRCSELVESAVRHQRIAAR